MKKMLFAAALAFTFYLSPFTLKAQEATPSSVLTSIAQTQRQNATEVQKYQFKQTKHTPMLATDAVRMGYMVVGPQKYMEWHYTDADPYALVMEGEIPRTMDLRQEDLPFPDEDTEAAEEA